MENFFSENSETRALLMRKLLAICPACKKKIFGNEIDVTQLDISKINHWPVRYVHCHSYNNVPIHALTLYIDANFSVRGQEVSNFVKIQK